MTGVGVAKQNTHELPKFRLLQRDLGVSRATLLGHLQLMWCAANTVAWSTGLPVFPDGEHVEAAAEWEGEPNRFFEAAVRRGWLDARETGGYVPHDYWAHAPDWVKKKIVRMRDERRRGPGNSSHISTESGHSPPLAANDGQRRTSSDNGGQRQPMAGNTNTDQDRDKNAESNRTRARGVGGPVAVGSILVSAVSELDRNSLDAMVERITAATREGEETGWPLWWRDAIEQECLYFEGEGLGVIWDALAKLENARGDNGKGEGPFHDPGKFMVAQWLGFCRAKKRKWGSFPRPRGMRR